MLKTSNTTLASVLGSVLLLAACADETASPQVDEATEAGSGAIGEVVQTSLGAVRGETVTENDVTAYIYRGIPYATPPVGDLRWKAPQPAAAWDGELDATEWPNRCPQGESSMGAGGPISEDCLYLNVVTAAESSDERRPVMVFFHGGGLTTGTGNSTTYNHPMLPNKGVVLVTVNSRLGPIGYLAHPALSQESGMGSGNYGTQDLRASLEWVRDNIEAFGGDPSNVTIFGESGGGTKVISQMGSPESGGLFHKAIVQSGSALVSEDRVTMLEDAEATGVRLGEALGVDASGDVLEQMRAASWEDVLEASSADGVDFRANVVVDGHVIPEPVSAQFANGSHHKVPLIVGANEGEQSLQTSVPLMANLHSAAGAPTWVYNFTQLPAGWRAEEGCVAFHGLELTYVFGAVPRGLTSPTTLFLARGGGCSQETPAHDDEDLRVAEQSAEIWAQFAKSGDPSVEGLAEWPQYSESGNVYFDLSAEMAAKENVQSSYVAPPAN